MNLRFGSVCSGIEAASVAWHPLGWQATWLSEIEAFPSAVLRHHYPTVPNLGNMCLLPLSMALDEIEAPDILVGGTPCQSFSLAGLRSGLTDSRGQLTLKYVELLNEIDAARKRDGSNPCIAVWENVPGVLSSKDNAFGCFLAALSGESEPLPANDKGRWPSAGLVVGPQRTIAWRTLDAQYFGLAQRRKRVFLVASARDDFHPGQVFFESNGLRGHSPTSRSKGEEVAQCLTSRTGGRYDPETETILGTDRRGSVTHSLRGEGFDASEDGTGRGTPLVVAQNGSDIQIGDGRNVGTISASQARQTSGDLIAFSAKDYGADASSELSPTIRAGTHKDSHSNGGVMPAIAFTDMRGDNRGPGLQITGNMANTLHCAKGQSEQQIVAFNHNAQAAQLPTDARDTSRSDSLTTSQQAAVAYVPAISIKGAANGRAPQNGPQYGETLEDIAYTQNCVDVHGVMTPEYRVRRLTPRECERLQGFPDDYTLIPIKGKSAADCPDGPRYKALGNSMAVPCMRWIGERIEKALQDSWMDKDNWL